MNTSISMNIEELNVKELIELSSVDSNFFNHTFFPKTVRMRTPNFLKRVDDLIDSNRRLVSLQMFRGSSKTTRLRMYLARKIAFGQAHTVLFVGNSQDKAIHSVKWIKKAIDHNRLFTETFQLHRGSKWQDTEIEIFHGVDEYPINIIAYGITGSVRGVNIDDFRPDLIVCDDILNEENTATELQLKKTEDLVYGALMQSLAPESEAPDAKMVMLQTPFNMNDLSVKSLNDPSWLSARFGCWTQETENDPLDQRESVWAERFPSEVLRQDKLNHIRRNQLSLFTREMECKITNPELNSFREEWIEFYDIPPDDIYTVLAIDPVPPPSPIALAKGLKGKDHEALAVVGKKGKNYFLLDYSLNTGHTPTWTVTEFFRLARKWKIKRVVVESVAYQRTLAWLLRQAMQQQNIYYPVVEYDDKRQKYHRILDALNGISSHGHFFVRPYMADFISAFTNYPNIEHDDLLDAVSIALSEVNNHQGEFESIEAVLKAEREMQKLTYNRGAP